MWVEVIRWGSIVMMWFSICVSAWSFWRCNRAFKQYRALYEKLYRDNYEKIIADFNNGDYPQR
jgi:hypothetical protein